MYERRLIRLVAMIAVLLAVVLGRAFYVQVVAAESIVRARESVLRSTRTVLPRRGEILWGDGTPAVRNASRTVVRIDVRAFDAPRFRCRSCGNIVATALPKEGAEAKPPKDACSDCRASAWDRLPGADCDALARTLRVERAKLDAALTAARAVYRARSWRDIDLLPDLRPDRACAIALASHAAVFPGISVRAEPTRESDPEIHALAGRIHLPWEEDVKALCSPDRAAEGLHTYTQDEAARTPVGDSGIELRYDESLRGVPGIVERPAVRAGTATPPAIVVREVVDGAPVRLTLLRDLQREAQAVVDASPSTCAAAVVLDLRDGAVVAMASRNTEDSYFRPIVALVPGSVFKLVPALAILEAGIDPHATLDCAKTGRLQPSGQKYTCTGTHPGADLWSAFGDSCNHFFMHRAEDAGPRWMADAYERLGMGVPLKLGVGMVPRDGWTDEWASQTAQLGIGQSHALTTPLQVATAYARVATRGRKIVPFLDRDIGPPRESREIDPVIAKFADVLRDAARRTVEDGTARRVDGLRAIDAAGKSGTAEVPVKGRGRTNNAWFVGFAPFDAPRFVAVVVHERVDPALVSHGASLAGPDVARILEAALRER